MSQNLIIDDTVLDLGAKEANLAIQSGPLSHASDAEKALRVRQIKLSADINTRRSEMLKRSPYYEEYQQALNEYLAFGETVTALTKERDSAHGADHMSYSDQLRKLKNDGPETERKVSVKFRDGDVATAHGIDLLPVRGAGDKPKDKLEEDVVLKLDAETGESTLNIQFSKSGSAEFTGARQFDTVGDVAFNLLPRYGPGELLSQIGLPPRPVENAIKSRRRFARRQIEFGGEQIQVFPGEVRNGNRLSNIEWR